MKERAHVTGLRLGHARGRAMRGDMAPDAPIERIRRHLFGLRMPRALEMLGEVVRQPYSQ